MAILVVATERGIHRLTEADGRLRVERVGFASGAASGAGGSAGGSPAGGGPAGGIGGVVALAADPAGSGLVLAAAADGVWFSRDAGATWTPAAGKLEHRVTSVAVSAADGRWYAGTEPSYVLVSADGGRTWEELEGLRHVPSRPRWSFPPRPWTHHVSALAPHPENPAVLLAGIELGGIMRTTDGGRRFADHAPGAHLDSHVLCVHRAAPDRFYQGAGEGTAQSRDGGRTWQPTDDGLRWRYVTALAVDAGDPDVVYAATSPSAGRAWYSDDAEARLLVRRGDGPWALLTGRAAGLPEQFTSPITGLAADPGAPGTVYAALQDGTLLRGTAAGERWERLTADGGSDGADGESDGLSDVRDLAAV